MSEIWEVVHEQFGALLQRAESADGGGTQNPNWRVVSADGRLSDVVDEAAGIAIMALEARRVLAGRAAH